MPTSHDHVPRALFAVACLLLYEFPRPAFGQEPVTVSGEWASPVPLRHELFSVAVGQQIAKVADGFPEKDASLMACLEGLGSPVLRIPGGDSMNHWNWDTGTSVGRKRPGLTFPRWLGLMNPGKSCPLWGINVSSVSAEVTGRFARALADAGDAGRYFELGNELYCPAWQADVADVEEYIRKSSQHAAVLREQFPQCRLGVPLASYWQLTRTTKGQFDFRQPAQLSPWIRRLAAETYYDAIVVHLYTTPLELGDLGDHAVDEVAHWGWLRAGPDVVDRLFGLLAETAPGKDVWVTEWALNASQYLKPSRGHASERRWQVHLTMLAALHDAAFLLNTASGDNKVQIMTTWTLVDQPPVAVWKREGGPTIRFQLLRLLREARDGNNRIARLRATGQPQWRGPAGTRFASLAGDAASVYGLFRDDALRSVVVLNPTDTPVRLASPLLPEGHIRTRALTADALLPHWGNPGNPLPAAWVPPYRVESLAATAAPARSVTVFTSRSRN